MRTGWTLSARAAVPAFRWPFERSARVRVEDRALHVVEDEAERAQERSFERVNPIPPGPKLGKPPYSFQAGANRPDLCIEWLCGNQPRHVRSYNGRSSSGADAQIMRQGVAEVLSKRPCVAVLESEVDVAVRGSVLQPYAGRQLVDEKLQPRAV